MPYYGYHPRVKQRIRSGELIGYHWDDNYPPHWSGAGAGVQHIPAPAANPTGAVAGIRGYFSGLEARA